VERPLGIEVAKDVENGDEGKAGQAEYDDGAIDGCARNLVSQGRLLTACIITEL
jgi:hypothetical protein